VKKKYFVSDSYANELHIWSEKTDLDADDEFIFDTLKDAKTHCIERIDKEIEDLEYNKQLIKNCDGK
jgi:hypothetical protein